MLFDLANLPYWICLGTGLLLFLLVIVGGSDDFDADTDVDGDIDIDGDGDVNPLAFLGWFGFGRVPLLLLLAIDFCLVGLSGWMLNVLVGELLGFIPGQLFGVNGLISIVAVAFSLVVGGAVTGPISALFATFGEDTRSDRLVGFTGTVTSSCVPKTQIGQVDVFDADRNRVTVSATLPEWAMAIPQRGDEVVVIDRVDRTYIVIIRESPDFDRWMSVTSPSAS
ncbi:MAG: DUF1449 family protein [Cyanobacteriota bacterium]|nr:DUF1449 family protein [Cyanobacteriota bacterium]